MAWRKLGRSSSRDGAYCDGFKSDETRVEGPRNCTIRLSSLAGTTSSAGSEVTSNCPAVHGGRVLHRSCVRRLYSNDRIATPRFSRRRARRVGRASRRSEWSTGGDLVQRLLERRCHCLFGGSVNVGVAEERRIDCVHSLTAALAANDFSCTVMQPTPNELSPGGQSTQMDAIRSALLAVWRPEHG
jgi:hypothetical protein